MVCHNYSNQADTAVYNQSAFEKSQITSIWLTPQIITQLLNFIFACKIKQESIVDVHEVSLIKKLPISKAQKNIVTFTVWTQLGDSCKYLAYVSTTHMQLHFKSSSSPYIRWCTARERETEKQINAMSPLDFKLISERLQWDFFSFNLYFNCSRKQQGKQSGSITP